MFTLEFSLNFLNTIVTSFSSFWDTINTPIKDLLADVPLVGEWLSYIPISDFTLLFLMFSGLGIYVVYQLIVWLLNLIT